MYTLSDLEKNGLNCEIPTENIISQKSKFAIDDFLRGKISVDEMVKATFEDEYPACVYIELLDEMNVTKENQVTQYLKHESLKEICKACLDNIK